MRKNSGHEFMVNTRYANISPSPQNSGNVPQPPLELPLPEDAALIPLPRPAEFSVPVMDLRAAIEARRTVRAYSETPLSLEELSYLLWVSQGVKRISSRPSTARTVPSAGARHAFETYLLVNRVEGLDAGLYRYAAIENSLLRLEAPADIAERIAHDCLEQAQITNSAATFIWAAVLERMYWRYVERGYRYLHLDAGQRVEDLVVQEQ
ncbi:MAG: SagB/ThcOx family dehydrogenase, partial [Anaerolineaceae bacterium]